MYVPSAGNSFRTSRVPCMRRSLALPRQVSAAAADLAQHSPPFHLAFPVRDLVEARRFYSDALGCSEGRSSERCVCLCARRGLQQGVKDDPEHLQMDQTQLFVVTPLCACRWVDFNLYGHQARILLPGWSPDCNAGWLTRMHIEYAHVNHAPHDSQRVRLCRLLHMWSMDIEQMSL
jgi:extradiol dioxygenase family protein